MVDYIDHSIREHKGKSLLNLLSDYIVVDIETTGLYSECDEIIEIAALRVVNNCITDKYCTLVKPSSEISSFITQLTGITNEMVENAPEIEKVLPDFFEFIGAGILVGHNVNFDVNFIYDIAAEYGLVLKNSFVDTMRFARRVLPKMEHYRLSDISNALGVEYDNAHRAAQDCNITYSCYEKLKETALASPDILTADRTAINISRRNRPHSFVKAADISSEQDCFDENHILFGKVCVITGALEKMSRKEAMQAIADVGGINGDSVTKKTNYLILGNNDYSASIVGGKSNKQKKAEEYMLKGIDIQVVPESVFYDMLRDE